MNNLCSAKPKLYLAGPLGFSEVGRSFHTNVIIPMVIEIGFEPLDPWTFTPDSKVQPVLCMPRSEQQRKAWMKLNRVFGRNNARCIRACDAVFAVVDGMETDSGTASEIGYAAGLGGRIIIAYRGDFREAGDNPGSSINLQVEEFVFMSGGKMVRSIKTARSSLRRLHTKLLASREKVAVAHHG